MDGELSGIRGFPHGAHLGRACVRARRGSPAGQRGARISPLSPWGRPNFAPFEDAVFRISGWRFAAPRVNVAPKRTGLRLRKPRCGGTSRPHSYGRTDRDSNKGNSVSPIRSNRKRAARLGAGAATVIQMGDAARADTARVRRLVSSRLPIGPRGSRTTGSRSRGSRSAAGGRGVWLYATSVAKELGFWVPGDDLTQGRW